MSKRTRSIDDVHVSSTSLVEEDTQTLSVPHTEEQDEPPRNRSRPDSDDVAAPAVAVAVAAPAVAVAVAAPAVTAPAPLRAAPITLTGNYCCDIECFNVNDCIQIVDQEIERLNGSYVTGLYFVHPRNEPFPHAAFRHLIERCAPTLRELRIGKCGPMTESIFLSLRSCTALTYLDFDSNIRIGSGDIPAILQCPFLPRIDYFAFTLRDVSFYHVLMRHARTMHHLQMYEKQSVGISHFELMMLPPTCDVLYAKFLSMDEDEMEQFGRATRLTQLIVRMEDNEMICFDELFENAQCLDFVFFSNVQQAFSCKSETITAMAVHWARNWDDEGYVSIFEVPNVHWLRLKNAGRCRLGILETEEDCEILLNNCPNVGGIRRVNSIHSIGTLETRPTATTTTTTSDPVDVNHSVDE
jgi:hypothetical protein